MKHGEYPGLVLAITMLASTERPALITRIKTDDPDIGILTHMVRLHDPQSMRIGLDELRSAFPDLLGQASDEQQVLRTCLTNSKDFVNAKVTVAIEPQMKNGLVQRNPNTKEPYFNIRLRSAVHDLEESIADKLITNILGRAKTKAKTEEDVSKLTELNTQLA